MEQKGQEFKKIAVLPGQSAAETPLFDSKTEMDFLLLRQHWRVFQCHRKVLDLFVFQYDDFIFTFFQQCAG